MPSGSVAQIIANAANANGVPPALALQIAIQESSLNPLAKGIRGELGLFQLMPATAAQLGVANPYDPAQNAAGGTAYLAQLFAKYGNWATALTAYNWGEGNVDKYGAAAAPASTQSYVQQALASVSTDYSATVTPASVANGVTDFFSPADSGGDTIDASLFPTDGTSPNWILLALLGFGVYVVWDLLEE